MAGEKKSKVKKMSMMRGGKKAKVKKMMGGNKSKVKKTTMMRGGKKAKVQKKGTTHGIGHHAKNIQKLLDSVEPANKAEAKSIIYNC